MYRTLLLFPFFLLMACSEKQETHASFYYWKTNVQFSETEEKALQTFHTQDLYLRFFDVDKQNDSIVPLGMVNDISHVPDSIHITPVVFITNRSLIDASADAIKLLAKRLCEKVLTKMYTANRSMSEIQIDCDWSETTRNAYFLLLQEIKGILPDKQLSVTVRLHQVKYPLRSGVPPADKATLMFYNMGDVHRMGAPNSIYNESTAQKYTAFISSYSLPLDFALPVFSWQLQFRKDELIDIISKDDMPDTANALQLKRSADRRIYEIKSSFLHKGHYYKEGDLLKTERLSKEELIEAASLLAVSRKKDSKSKIIFFDLDEYNLNSYSYETFREVLDILR